MLKILLVEDEAVLAAQLKYLIELNPLHQVTGVAEDLAGALEAVEQRRPDLALVDLHLANGSTGFNVAAKLNDRGIPCLFTSGNAPSFAIPDLALGCLAKPFSEEDLVRALRAAEDIIRGRERLRPKLPETLKIYVPEEEGSARGWPAFFPKGRAGMRRRLSSWWSAA